MITGKWHTKRNQYFFGERSSNEIKCQYRSVVSIDGDFGQHLEPCGLLIPVYLEQSLSRAGCRWPGDPVADGTDMDAGGRFHSWRQADTAAMARHFVNKALYLASQIDWAGASAGYGSVSFLFTLS